MAVSYVDSKSASLHGSTAAFVVTKPTGTTDGDILVALIASTSPHDPPDSSWTVIEDTHAPNDPFDSRYVMAWWKLAGPSEPSSYTLAAAVGGSGRSIAGGIIAWRGADPLDPVDASNKTVRATSGGALTLPSLTTTRPDDVLIGFVGGHANASWSSPGPMVEAWDFKTGATGSPVNSVAAIEALGAPGPTGTRTFTPNVTTSCAGLLIAIGPPVDGWHVGSLGRSW